MGSSKDYHIAAEPDLKPKSSRHIWFYFIVLGVLLYSTIYGLEVMYRFTLRDEKEEKIGNIMTHAAIDQKNMAQAYLSGKLGLFPDKSHVAIEVALSKFLYDFRAASARESQ